MTGRLKLTRELNNQNGVLAGNAAPDSKRAASEIGTSISDNLLSWLKPLARAEGPVAPNVDAFDEKLKQLADDAEMRRGLTTHCGTVSGVSSTPDEKQNLPAAEMGNKPQVIFKHFRAFF